MRDSSGRARRGQNASGTHDPIHAAHAHPIPHAGMPKGATDHRNRRKIELGAIVSPSRDQGPYGIKGRNRCLDSFRHAPPRSRAGESMASFSFCSARLYASANTGPFSLINCSRRSRGHESNTFQTAAISIRESGTFTSSSQDGPRAVRARWEEFSTGNSAEALILVIQSLGNQAWQPTRTWDPSGKRATSTEHTPKLVPTSHHRGSSFTSSTGKSATQSSSPPCQAIFFSLSG